MYNTPPILCNTFFILDILYNTTVSRKRPLPQTPNFKPQTSFIRECELKNPEKVLARLERLLNTKNAKSAKVIQYPTVEDAEMPMAAEKPSKYRTKKR